MNTPGIAGADGCRSGWLVVRRVATGPVTAEIFPDGDTLFRALLPEHLLLIDVPIGLQETGPRKADIEARRYLGWPRRTSLFSAPIRPVLHAASWAAASEIRRSVEGKGMSRQAWGITGKIREIDEVIRKHDPGQSKAREGHPEVSFATWAGRPMEFPKKRITGRAERIRLIESHFAQGLVADLWSQIRGKGAAQDDLIDALAMLWSAERLVSGQAGILPTEPEYDRHGLRMEIVY